MRRESSLRRHDPCFQLGENQVGAMGTNHIPRGIGTSANDIPRPVDAELSSVIPLVLQNPSRPRAESMGAKHGSKGNYLAVSRSPSPARGGPPKPRQSLSTWAKLPSSGSPSCSRRASRTQRRGRPTSVTR